MATAMKRLQHFIILAASEEDDSMMSKWCVRVEERRIEL
jgi:hypothetical protein